MGWLVKSGRKTQFLELEWVQRAASYSMKLRPSPFELVDNQLIITEVEKDEATTGFSGPQDEHKWMTWMGLILLGKESGPKV